MLSFKNFLSPIVSSIEQISNFEKIEAGDSDLKIEYPYLIKVTRVISSIIKEKISRLKKLEDDLEKQVLVIENETGDDKKDAIKIYNSILKDVQVTVDRINREAEIIDAPYFGKIVFDRKRNSNFPAREVTAYIGKSGYFDTNTKEALITDWRAPIANLYYTNSGPTRDVSFESPVGVQHGDLTEKKMFEISKARIKSIYNSKTGNSAADEFLLSQLGQKIGKKLSDIVSTIQESQNKIIRDTINKFVILQGVAGSGKTTIVLHRLAYIIFSYQKDVKPEKTLIIAPNKLFLDYISDVLPSLGIQGVETNTYLFWAKKLLGWDNKYILSTTVSDTEVQRIKSSKTFLHLVIEGFNNYIDTVVMNIPYSLSDTVHTNFYTIRSQSPNIPVFEALNLAVRKTLAEKMFKEGKVGSFTSNHEEMEDVIMSNSLKYLKKELDIMTIYRKIVSTSDVSKAVKLRTGTTVKKSKKYYYYDIEDIAPMVIIYQLLYGVSDIARDYVIADEAQDMSYAQIVSLLLVAKRGNLMLAGDLAQSIKLPNSIEDWLDVFECAKLVNLEKVQTEFHQLCKCYRTTVEIVTYVTRRINPLFPKSYLMPEAVLRHGDSVEEIVSTEELLKDGNDTLVLLEKVDEELKKGRNTVALITPDRKSASILYSNLKDSKINKYLIEFGTENYSSGVIIVPIIDAKGLEFDTVFIVDVTEKNYPYTFESARKFYVAGTRAIHSLYITYPKDNISRIITNE